MKAQDLSKTKKSETKKSKRYIIPTTKSTQIF